LAIAEHLRQSDDAFDALFLGSARGIEARVVPQSGFALHCIPGSGFRRLGLFGRIKALWGLLLGLCSALGVVWRFAPDVVVATGGWASLAGGLAAILLRKPLLVQEQNSVPGFSNRFLGRWADQVHVAFPGTEGSFAHPDRVRLTGNPLRSVLLQEARVDADSTLNTILVIGGSRGARSINRAVGEAIPILEAAGVMVQWVWQTGTLDYADIEPHWVTHPRVMVRAFLDDIATAYSRSCLLVCRAGAMTLSEITALGKPAILVPFPGAVDDHQTRNARVLEDAGAAVLVADAELDGVRLAAEIERLLRQPQTLQDMAQRATTLARPRATEELANAIRGLADVRQRDAAVVVS
jgi:UDP-N-acetylglucosamine--N-acetylmuramyl-(pentapeptide) pyrophosphoryl-undecaprenol N-acetylglucosamine transferase